MNTQKIDLNLLHVFDAVMTYRSLTVAGAHVGLTQSTMSHALNRLRKLCGDPLFVRTSHGMDPTPYAQQLAGSVRQVLDTVQASLGQPASFDPASATRTFTLLMSDIGQTDILPVLVRRIAKLAPGVNVVVDQVPSDLYREVLQSGRADLAIGYLPQLRSGFFQQRLFEDGYVCLLDKERRVVGKKLTLADYLAAPHVAVTTPGMAEGVIDKVLSRKGLARRVAVRVPHFLVAPSLIKGTALIVTVPSRITRVPGILDMTRIAEPPFRIPPIQVRQFWHERFHHDHGNKWLRGVVANLFAEAPA